MSAAIWRQQGRCVDKSAAFDIGMVVPCVLPSLLKKITSYTDANIRWVCYSTACCCLRRIRPIIRLINKVCHDLLSNFLLKIWGIKCQNWVFDSSTHSGLWFVRWWSCVSSVCTSLTLMLKSHVTPKGWKLNFWIICWYVGEYLDFHKYLG